MSIVKKEGFNFSFDTQKCEVCGGKCCTGSEGYVFVSIQEMLEITYMLGMEFEEFTHKFVRKIGYKFSFIEKPCDDGLACVFYDNGKCRIYAKRPKQCKDFPFWEGYKQENLTSQDSKSLQKECIGVCFES